MVTSDADKIKTVIQLWAEPSDFINKNGEYTVDFNELHKEISQIDFLHLQKNLLQVLQEFIDEQK